MLKKCNVHMLPTKKKAPIIKIGNWNKLTIPRSDLIVPTDKDKLYQHLYITSDDKIEESDWYIKKIENCMLTIMIAKKHVDNYNNKNCKKIIATTNSSLGLPQPSESFIQKYVEEYNKGNVITKFMVEYKSREHTWECGTNYIRCSPECTFDNEEKIKINPKDNTITIKKVKDSWTRDEVICLIKEFRNCIVHIDESRIRYTDNWIEENL